MLGQLTPTRLTNDCGHLGDVCRLQVWPSTVARITPQSPTAKHTVAVGQLMALSDAAFWVAQVAPPSFVARIPPVLVAMQVPATGQLTPLSLRPAGPWSCADHVTPSVVLKIAPKLFATSTPTPTQKVGL